jgi:Secretion system C-terminal sorting domain
VAPDAWFNEGNQPFLSRERYWNVSGIWTEGFKASATIDYNGRNAGANYPDGYLDNDLIRIQEDSMVLMYRSTPSSSWEIDKHNTFDIRSPFDKRGTIEINELRRGEYALAIRDATLLSVENIETSTNQYLKIYPNPTDGELNFEIKGASKAWLEVTSSNGQLMHREFVRSKKRTVKVDTTSWSRGVYYAGLVISGEPYAPKLFIVR